ncbi:hypothetical protein SDC9_177085 [bioreactor metagenome]|uniref:Uncharacterized protein n=1 Tax=bioreactor metagenome TaxID=1076179 RepID=A0A645GUG7_9ZZZZ
MQMRIGIDRFNQPPKSALVRQRGKERVRTFVQPAGVRRKRGNERLGALIVCFPEGFVRVDIREVPF